MDSRDTTRFPRGQGYLYFMAWLQIAAGALTTLFSVFGVFHGLVNDSSLLNPVEVGGESHGFWLGLVSGYIVFQMTYGWIFGLLHVASGVCCFGSRARGFVIFANAVNLLNFPHGTTVAFLTLHGMGVRSIARVFKGGATIAD
jgi:hypothetical protein